MRVLWQEGELVFGAAKPFAQPSAPGVKQRHTDYSGALEDGADFNFRVPFFDALKRAARYAGAVRQFLCGQLALLSGKLNELAKQCERFAGLA